MTMAWSRFQTMSDLVLTPASCYPIYAAVGARPPLCPGGVTIDPGAAYVFRREPSDDPSRLQMFHMRELVRIAEQEVQQRGAREASVPPASYIREALGAEGEATDAQSRSGTSGTAA